MLGKPRGSGVFRPPIRAALQAADREEAQRIIENAIRLRVSAQAWGIYQKVAQLDARFQEDPNLQHWVKEVHPEVCFWAWNDSQAMGYAKKTREGKRDRQLLISGFFGASPTRMSAKLMP
jgi:predicted RNase H-like nuclease